MFRHLATVGIILGVIATAYPAKAQGLALFNVGPVNQSMGGAAVAAPIDAGGALHWNPASIVGLPSSEALFALELLLPDTHLRSTVPAGALGPGVPAATLSGSSRSEPGVAPIPSVAVVLKRPDSYVTYGLGIYGIAGFSVNYPASTTNPILTAQPPNGIGLGRIFANADVLQIAPTAAVQLTDRLSVGFAPTVTLANVSSTPGFLDAPDDANMDGFPSYAPATGSRYRWAGGFQLGVYYEANECWRFGASFKSPQWFEDFEFKSEDELGRPRELTFEFDYPMIISVGAAYDGVDRLTAAVDVRYFDYENADGFGAVGFRPDGAVNGLGWRSIFSVATGAQYQLTDVCSVRLGYHFNENPIGDSVTSFNVATPLHYQHILATGVSMHIAPCVAFHLAYAHSFTNTVSGPIVAAIGPIPGTQVSTDVTANAVTAGMTVKF